MLGRACQAQMARRASAVCLVALGAITLFGCSSQRSQQGPSAATYQAEITANPLHAGHRQALQAPQQLKGTLLVWTQKYQGMDPLLQAKLSNSIRKMAKSFEQIQPGVNVVIEEYPDTVFYKNYQRDLKYGLGPDVMLVHSMMVGSLARDKLLKPFPTQAIRTGEIKAKLLEQVKWGGDLYGLPFLVDVQALCFNRDHVKTAPQSLEQLRQFARQGISIGLNSSFLKTIWGAPGFGAYVFNERGESSLNPEGWSQWIEALRQLDREPQIVLIEPDQTIHQYFITGELSIIPCRSHVLPLLREKIGSEKLGVASLPSVNNTPARPPLGGLSLTLSPIMSARQQKLATALALHMTNRDVQQIMAIEWNALLPVNSESDFNRHLFPTLQSLTAIYENSVGFSLEEWSAILASFDLTNSLYSQAINGEIEAKVAAERIQRALKEAMP